MLFFKPKYSAFFSEIITKKQFKKCCRYNQDGKPLSPIQVQVLYETMKPMIEGWKVTDLRLYKYFYTEDYLSGIQFIKDVSKIDALSTKNCPSVHLVGGELLTLELFSPSLNGLSQVDFDLAMRINQMNFNEYFLIPLESLENYKKEVQAYKLKKQAEQIQQELASTQK
ncbi:unnamed protein product [Paramecium sonneborni]|uniref:4-alpha-hydroxy-tetrahydropterin dehydratase n=1 Tax=Paramecium sonneborni TaxID=65129 RepID=A0A8S1LWE3_9CILI|nr:unnamed protein product [Paramecium sonneborni]